MKTRDKSKSLEEMVQANRVQANVSNDPDLRMDAPYVVPTRYWHRLGDGRIQCDLCPRFCKLRNGQRGFCFVRACLDDQIVLATYGRSTGFCVDPIEKKPLNHFFPGSAVLSFGTAGCNLGCKFCQNWDISKASEIDVTGEHAPGERIAQAAGRLGCRSVAYTYNDPLIFQEYAIDVARACRAEGIRSVAVSAGEHCAEPRGEFYQYMDAVNIDLKAFTERFYRNICAGRLQPVLDTLKYIKHETDVWLEITNLMIPGENDSPEETAQMTSWIMRELGPDVPLHFTAFYPTHRMRDKPPTPPDTLRRARQIALGAGLRYVYTGNTYDPEGQATYCHVCHTMLIGRVNYDIAQWKLSAEGTCRECGTPCAGVFEPQPGDWGNRRLPVQLSDYAQPQEC